MKSICIAACIAAGIFLFSCGNKTKSPDAQTLDRKLTTASTQSFKLEELKDYNGNAGATTPEYFGTLTNADENKQVGDQEKQPAPPKQQQQKKEPQIPIGNPDWDKKIIKTGQLNAEVKDYKTFTASLREKIKALGGYIAQEEQDQSDYKIENTLVIKVPVDQFDNAITQLTNDAQKVDQKKISSQDVTAEIVDTKSRMEAKKQVRLRYLDLLKQAKNMDDILAVQSEIDGIQEEIESATGQIDYLSHSATYSTINYTYYQVLNATAKEVDGKPSFGTKLSGAFSQGWSWVGNVFVGLITIWPLMLMVFIAILFFKRSRVKKPA